MSSASTRPSIDLSHDRSAPGPLKPLFFLAVGILCLMGTVYVIGYSDDFNLTASDVMSLVIIGGAALGITHFLIRPGGTVIADLGKPASIYAFFYLFYYIIPTWIAIVINSPARHNILEISGLIVASLFTLWFGLRITCRESLPIPEVSEGRAIILLWCCYIGMGLLIWMYAWRISVGSFYTHIDVDPLQTDTGIFTGLMQSFVGPIQLPIILLLGIIGRSTRRAYLHKVLYLYSAASIFVYAASSQFRPAATAIFFLFIAANMMRRTPLRLKAYLVAGAASIVILLTIQGVRLLIGDRGISGNQLSESLLHTKSGISSSLTRTGTVQQSTLERMTNQIAFTSEVMDEVRNGHPYEYGRLLVLSAYAIVPRLLWPNKPTVTSMQLLMRQDFNLDIHDDAAGPLVEGYANGGWFVTLASFVFIGVAGGWLTNMAGRRPTFFWILALCFWWGNCSVVEQEIVLSTLSSLRCVVILAALCSLAHYLLSRGSRRVQYHFFDAGAKSGAI